MEEGHISNVYLKESIKYLEKLDSEYSYTIKKRKPELNSKLYWNNNTNSLMAQNEKSCFIENNFHDFKKFNENVKEKYVFNKNKFCPQKANNAIETVIEMFNYKSFLENEKKY